MDELNTPDIYQGSGGWWHFHYAGYTSGQFFSYSEAQSACARYILNKQWESDENGL